MFSLPKCIKLCRTILDGTGLSVTLDEGGNRLKFKDKFDDLVEVCCHHSIKDNTQSEDQKRAILA